jgi:hypothetical protein
MVETEAAGGGFYAGPPSFGVSHGELVSTVADFHRFTRLLVDGRVDGEALLSAEHLQQMTSDQVPAENKTPDSFFPGFWDGMGWGFGVGVQTEGPAARPVRLVRRTGHRLLRRPGRDRRHLVHPGGARGTDVAVARRVQGPSPADVTSKVQSSWCLSVTSRWTKYPGEHAMQETLLP